MTNQEVKLPPKAIIDLYREIDPVGLITNILRWPLPLSGYLDRVWEYNFIFIPLELVKTEEACRELVEALKFRIAEPIPPRGKIDWQPIGKGWYGRPSDWYVATTKKSWSQEPPRYDGNN